MNKNKTICAAALSLLLSACGGGAPTPVDNSALYTQAITQAAGNYVTTMPKITPPSPPAATGSFQGANVRVAGKEFGYARGTDPYECALALALNFKIFSSQYPDYYRALLSSDGLQIVVEGTPDITFVAKLTSNGVSLTQI